MATKRLKQSEDDDKGSYNNGDGIDRLTTLPDPLIHHIFSFLPSLFSVQTSLCIKSLQHIWRSIPNLDFIDTDFKRKYDYDFDEYDDIDDCYPFSLDFYDEQPGDRSDYRFNFYGFLNVLMRRRDFPEIEKLRLRCGNLRAHDIEAVTKINDIMISAMKHCHIRALDLEVSNSYGYASENPFKMTRRILTCASLRELKLCLSGFRINFPTSIRLPVLRTLHLKWVKYCNHRENEVLFSQSPFLENLIIEYCEFNKVKPLKISAQQLKHLTIMGMLPPNTTFSTPNLVSLKLCHDDEFTWRGKLLESSLFFVDKLVSLAEADINVPVMILFIHSCSPSVVTESSLQLIGALQNAHSLTLSRLFIESYAFLLKEQMYVLDHIRIPFYNLKWLKVETPFYGSPIVVINTILNQSPNIENLILESSKKSGVHRNSASACAFEAEELGFDYQLMHLKSACFHNINLTGDNEVMFMLHLLRNSVSLQKFVLVDPRNRAKFNKGRIEEMLLKLPPASQAVEILVK